MGVTGTAQVKLPVSQDMAPPVRGVEPMVGSRTELKEITHDMHLGKQVVYKVCITAKADKGLDPPKEPLAECVQKVIDKHSAPGGTLCGTIPNNTHAIGYECNIELLPNVPTKAPTDGSTTVEPRRW